MFICLLCYNRQGISRCVPTVVTKQRGKKTSRMVDLFSSAVLISIGSDVQVTDLMLLP